jgi:rhamnogalacturonyl hydrolase YesR
MSMNILTHLEKLDQWIRKNGWSGYDPYDIKEIPWILKITDLGQKSRSIEILREGLFEIFNTFPTISRKILHIPPRINAKAMGLFSQGYLDLFNTTANHDYLDYSKQCLDWLKLNKAKGYPGLSWGYPFNWQSEKLISRNTPNGIVTTAAGEAFWNWYKLTGEKEYLEACKNICEFLISLPKDRISKNAICFSYTPLFINHVHNLNLFIAEFLLKTGLEIKNAFWIKTATHAINYTLSNQLENGSFDYSGPPEKPSDFVDNYHTGFVLRMLFSICKITDDQNVLKSLKRCYTHYINNFFENAEIPKLLPDRKYRIDIHSCAESINCLSELSNFFDDALPLARRVANWTIDNLQDRSGYFYYGILKGRVTGIPRISKIAYIRWGQAWMLKGLSNLLKQEEISKV